MDVREDTPAVAVARKREVLWLQEVLLARARASPLIQKEPGNALARFLFSSMLSRPAREEGGAARDALIPSHVSYDRSVLHELRKNVVDMHEARSVCRTLCLESA
jgi:hypothetical protein